MPPKPSFCKLGGVVGGSAMDGDDGKCIIGAGSLKSEVRSLKRKSVPPAAGF